QGTSPLPTSISHGDTNGDGYDDAVLGITINAPFNLVQAGGFLVLQGSSSPDIDIDISHIVTGNSARLGVSAATQDINGDGYDDVIVGASQYSSSTGRAYVYY